MDIKRMEIYHSPGRFGWNGGFGATAYIDPADWYPLYPTHDGFARTAKGIYRFLDARVPSNGIGEMIQPVAVLLRTRNGMPRKTTVEKSKQAKRQGKAASTQAGPFVEEQMHKMHEGKGRAKSSKQAVAIGLSEARRAGVPVKNKLSSSRTKKKR